MHVVLCVLCGEGEMHVVPCILRGEGAMHVVLCVWCLAFEGRGKCMWCFAYFEGRGHACSALRTSRGGGMHVVLCVLGGEGACM